MKRIFLVFFLFIATTFILSACASSVDVTPTLPIAPVLLPTATLDSKAYADSCSAIVAEPTLAPSSESYFPPVSAADFIFGPADAPVTITEYCDFQSNGCRGMAAVIAKLMKNRSNVRFVFRPFPLIGLMDKSDKAVLAALAADEQGKFWTMYDFLFVTYPTWDKLKPEEFNAWVIKESAPTGIDPKQLEAAINDPKTTTRMMSIYQATKKLNLPRLPILLVNGNLPPSYVLDYQSLNGMVNLILLGQKQFTQCPPFDVNPLKQYIATIHTDKGDIVIQLFPDKAPLAVNSFIFLARQKWFDGVIFYRVIPGFIAQAGDPSGTGNGNPGYFFKNEDNDLHFDKPGMLAMANSGPNTNGSQFFITFAPASHLDGAYTIFGQVIAGLDAAENLTPRDASKGGVLPEGDKIISVEIEEK